jgi:hypothetical protein
VERAEPFSFARPALWHWRVGSRTPSKAWKRDVLLQLLLAEDRAWATLERNQGVVYKLARELDRRGKAGMTGAEILGLIGGEIIRD